MRKSIRVPVGLASAAALIVLCGGPTVAATASQRFYVTCSLTDPGTAKVYHSAVFSAPEQLAGNSAHEFAAYLARTYGLRLKVDAKTGLGGPQCIEAADSGKARTHLEQIRQKKDASDPSWAVLVLTDFIPPEFKPSPAELQFEAEQQQYEAQRQQYQRDLAGHRAAEQKLARQHEAEAASAQQAARAKAEFDAQMKKFSASQAEYKRQRALYELEYQKATGTKPPH
jgi:hypothetical protein